jgi:hypothetical protein
MALPIGILISLPPIKKNQVFKGHFNFNAIVRFCSKMLARLNEKLCCQEKFLIEISLFPQPFFKDFKD